MNKKRKEIEDKIVELAKKSPEKVAGYLLFATSEYMNTLSEDISEAIGTYSEPFLPWIIAVLENYATALRQQMDEHGNKLLDAIKKLPNRMSYECVFRRG